jgi:threonine dehydrogenase-like Zn-dependent dehydrogenase
MNYKSFWHTNSNSSEIISETFDAPTHGIEIVKSLYSSISLGTEKLVSQGNIPLEMHDLMKVPHMKGTFKFPIKYGYSVVGKNSKNKLVHLMHPHQSVCFVNENDCYLISDSLNPIIATQISNMETVINAIWVSNLKPNQKVLVCGIGSVGVLLLETLKIHYKIDVYFKETNDYKIKKLIENGHQNCENNQEFDVCFNVSANEIGLQYCIDHCKTEGKIIELSWYGTQKVSLNLGVNFHYKRLQIISSQVSEIPIEKQKTETFLTRKKLAEKLLSPLKITPYISIISFESLPDFFRTETEKNFITIVKY